MPGSVRPRCSSGNPRGTRAPGASPRPTRRARGGRPDYSRDAERIVSTVTTAAAMPAATGVPGETSMPAEAAVPGEAAVLTEATMVAESRVPMRKAVAPPTMVPVVMIPVVMIPIVKNTANEPAIDVPVVSLVPVTSRRVGNGLRARGQAKPDADQQRQRQRQHSAALHGPLLPHIRS